MQMKVQPGKWLKKKTEETGSPGQLVQEVEGPTFLRPHASVLTSVLFEHSNLGSFCCSRLLS